MSGGKIDILIVDSSYEMVQLLADFLTSHDCRVDHESRGTDALAVERKRGHDFAIISNRTEGMTSKELIAQLVRVNPDIFVIYLAPAERDVSRSVSADHPYFRRLSSPVVLEELWAIIEANKLSNIAG